jgi:SAM-dependent methyltransferase
LAITQRPTYKATCVTKASLVSQAIKTYKRKGLYYVVRLSAIPIFHYLLAWYYRKFRSSEGFRFNGNTYRYLFHPYVTTWRNQRAAVIPIIWDIVKKSREQEKRVLEVGNMLSYYFKVDHDILDKYEIMDGVINEDVVDFNPLKRYDVIISIFTLSSVGWSEDIEARRTGTNSPWVFPQDPSKVLRAINNLNRLLAPGGQIVVVDDLGYNPAMDKLLKSGELRFDKHYYLKKISGYRWKEVDGLNLNEVKYDKSIPSANEVLIGVINKS